MLTELNENIRLRLLHEQVEILAKNIPGIALGTSVLASGTAYLLIHQGLSTLEVMQWLAAVVVYQLIRLGTWRTYRSRLRMPDEARGWALWLSAMSGAAGMLWGLLPILFFTPDAPFTVALIAIVLGAMLASASNSVGAYWPANLAFAITASLPYAIRCLLEDAEALEALGVLSIMYLLFTTSFARAIERSIKTSLLLRFEKLDLLDKLTEAKERAEQASQAKTHFLASASHDLRQPIHAMNMFVPALRKMFRPGQSSTGDVSDILGRMDSALDTMGGLLHVLLDISRLDAGSLRPDIRPTPLGPLLRKVVDDARGQASGKGLELRLVESDDWVLSDPGIMLTILTNLVVNALRYTERGGVLVGCRRKEEQIEIQVWDTGVGISPQDLPRLCEPFFQARNALRPHSQTRGFGLGLAIVKRSADLLGAELSIQSRLGCGSRFAISVQACDPPLASSGALSSHDLSPTNKTVLVIDNDEQILVAMQHLLAGWGHRVLSAHNLDEALTAAARHGPSLDLVLIDHHLGDNMTGLQAVSLLGPCLPNAAAMVLITGDTSPEVMHAAEAAGLEILHKPLTPSQLEALLAGQRSATYPHVA